MPDILPNVDGQVATEALNLYMVNEIIPNCTKIFAGGNIDEVIITDTRATFEDVNKLIADSIILVNRTKNPLSVDITILREIDSVPITFYLANKVPMVAFGKQEILNLCINSQGNEYTETILYVQNGDTIFASSDFVNNLFDCLISYREFTEL